MSSLDPLFVWRKHLWIWGKIFCHGSARHLPLQCSSRISFAIELFILLGLHWLWILNTQRVESLKGWLNKMPFYRCLNKSVVNGTSLDRGILMNHKGNVFFKFPVKLTSVSYSLQLCYSGKIKSIFAWFYISVPFQIRWKFLIRLRNCLTPVSQQDTLEFLHPWSLNPPWIYLSKIYTYTLVYHLTPGGFVRKHKTKKNRFFLCVCSEIHPPWIITAFT